MNSKLVSLFRQIIREEIRTELQIFKKEILREITSKPQAKILENTKTNPETYVNPVRQKKQSPKEYTKNPLLNKILNETEGIYEEAQVYGDPTRMKGGEFDFLLEDDEIPVYKPQKQPTTQPNRQPVIREDVKGPQGETIDASKPEVKKVLNIMNQDFSAKLKAMEKSAKTFRQ